MTSSDKSTIDYVLKTTLEQFEKHEPLEFKKLKDNPKQLQDLTGVIHKAAEEYLRLEEIKDLDKNADELTKYLPSDRIKMIKDGLTVPTYKMEGNNE